MSKQERARKWAARCERAYDAMREAAQHGDTKSAWRWNRVWRNSRAIAIALEGKEMVV